MHLCNECQEGLSKRAQSSRKVKGDASCPLCRLVRAATTLGRSSAHNELHSFSIQFHRLVLDRDVRGTQSCEVESVADPSPDFQNHCVEQDLTMTTLSSRMDRKIKGLGHMSPGQEPTVQMTASPSRSLTLHTRLPVGESVAMMQGQLITLTLD